MNNSARTTLIAQGIYLWAAQMNLAVKDWPGSQEQMDFEAWTRKPGVTEKMVEFVKIEQFRLFAIVNTTF